MNLLTLHNQGMTPVDVAVIGASGAVGAEIIGLLEDERWLVRELHAFTGSRSAGQEIKFRNSSVPAKLLSPGSCPRVDVAFLAADSEVSRKFAPQLADQGTLVIDNSSAFRLDPSVPLVIPEINGAQIGKSQIIANPNCCAVILCMALAPLAQLAPIKRVIVSTYQSASGGGREAMNELIESTKEALEGREFEPTVLPHPYAFNLFSHNTGIDQSGFNGEELKIISEVKKIMGQEELSVLPTCIRVPVLRAHSESVIVEFGSTAPGIAEARSAIRKFPGLELVDDREGNTFPMPSLASGKMQVLVGRLRHDPSDPHVLALFCCGDQLLKGAAWNAVQIMGSKLGLNIDP